MRKLISIFTLTLIINFHSTAQEIVEPSKVLWYSLEQADSLHAIQPRPWLIDVYTEWCGWCKHMMKTTFANPNLAAYINQNFYAVRFDAETFDTIKYENKIYTNHEIGKRANHDLAKMFLKNRMSFPTIVYRNRNKELFPVPGYFKTNGIEPFLVYFNEAISEINQVDSVPLYYFNQSYQMAYSNNFKEELAKIPDSLKMDTMGVIKWYDFETAFKELKTTPKRLFIYIDAPWCISCQVTKRSTLKNSAIAKIINDNFYPIQLNAFSQDSIQAFGKTFKGNGKGQPHQLAMALTNGKLRIPSMILMNGKTSIIINEFMTIQTQYLVLDYFIRELFTQNISLEQYIKQAQKR